NNWHFAKFASQEPDAFAWQIAPMFVILALIITIIPLYAILPIREQLRKLALHQNKVVFLSWQIVIGSLFSPVYLVYAFFIDGRHSAAYALVNA
ncbi:MAG: hypothetical protein IPM78_11780, partial [Moraxellaceae bacterium]|nr:hypothetical protein [Moraxellaceae bacterium]